jgi:hypothetical protein
VIANFDEKNTALKETRKRTYIGEDYVDVGLGWGILKAKNYHSHPGAKRGHRSMMMLDEVKKKGVVILSNVSTYHEDNRLISELAN